MLARSKLTNNYTFKGTFQLNRNNQVIGFLNKRNKLQELRDFAPPLVPIEAARYQASRNYPWKWSGPACSAAACSSTCSPATGTTSSRSIRPTHTASRRASFPAASTPATNQRTGYHDAYQDQKRYKPQFYIDLSYFQDGWHGSHDFKFGYRLEARPPALRPRAAVRHPLPRQLNGAVNELEIYNSPNTSTNDVVYTAGFISDNVEVQQSADASTSAAVRALRRQLPRTGDDAQRPAAARQLAGRPQPGRARALHGLHRAADGRRRVKSPARSTSRPAPASPTTSPATTGRSSRVTTAASTSTRPTRWPTRRTRSATRACAISSSTRTATGCSTVRRSSVCSARRRAAPASSTSTTTSSRPYLAGDLDALRARDHGGPVGTRLVCLQERP